MKTNAIKKLLILPLLLLAGTLVAQPPAAMPFQAVAKDNVGNPAKNRKVFVKVALIQGRINGTRVWNESFETTTNEDGIYTVNIGLGSIAATQPARTLGDLDWANGPFFVNVQIAVSPSIPASWWVAANNYVDIGTNQLMSVPYALFAGNASVTNVNTSITAGPKNTFLVTDSLGNVNWALPQAANQTVTNVTNFSLTTSTGNNLSIQPNTTAVVDVQVVGVMPGDPIVVTAQGDYRNWAVYNAWVSVAGTVKIRFANFTEQPVDVKGSEYKIIVIK
ncbi:hypothetical protein [Sediminibacterium soli]|uniref:hypothetical protein n=1 Tax=Sediminibacterium soli TaxID=2698829 RepID=UPI001379A9B8|nr:hypothetical protein [Sediminibacterium soli]NCI47915.1 hypothetical protein [Sediminibacterium soli]